MQKEDTSEESIIPLFWKQKYIRESQKSWNSFYKRNKDNFFKDRHWTEREFHILFQDQPYILLEMGCGVGNFLLPILERRPSVMIIGCDTSPNAIEILSNNEIYQRHSSRCQIFVCDISSSELQSQFFNKVRSESVDVVSLIFVLSAFHPIQHAQVIRNAAWALKPGGRVLFRDYAKDDYAQQRFNIDRKMQDDLYVRQDGTLSFFFTLEYLAAVFQQEGFHMVEHQYIHRKTFNTKTNFSADRIFIQSQWEKIGHHPS